MVKFKRKRKRPSLIIFVIEMVIFLLLTTGVFAYAKITESFDNFEKSSYPNAQSQENGSENGEGQMIQSEKIEINEGVTGNSHLSGFRNIALVGIDNREETLEWGNSDTMMIASINNDTQSVKICSLYRDTYLKVGDETYDKANSAYNLGGANKFLSMLNKNLDLTITDYVVVNFNAVAQLVDDLGGIAITMTAEEVTHMNNYCVETSEKTGRDYTPISPEVAGTYELNGVQAVSYARIRYTAGNDFKRTQRQRLVISKIIEKAKIKGLASYSAIVNDVFPLIKTNLSKAEIVELGSQIFNYEISDTTGFPFIHVEDNIGDLDPVIPVTLEQNVKELHQWLFDVADYEPSADVKEISDNICNNSGYGPEYIEKARGWSEDALVAAGSEADNM
ncbi:MAG: LCP family protein [Lachnospiraceae bacterium]|jgi:LCP family protein required for cell wall assembly